jgi:RES domain-containing protein
LSVTVYRIATETPASSANDLSGTGAKASGGRWNHKGTPVVYCASNRALACLETVVHLAAGGLPLNRFLVDIDIPDEIWASAQNACPPEGWDAEPCRLTSLAFGHKWITDNKTALMLVPSVIVPEEMNVLINPVHPDARRITALTRRRWTYRMR